MMAILLLIVSAALTIIEAFYEAVKGDRTHALSFTISILLFWIATLVLPSTGHEFIIDFLGLYVPCRLFFDLVYNFARGNKWSYLGETALSDRLIKKYVKNQHIVLVVRMVFAFSLFFFLGL